MLARRLDLPLVVKVFLASTFEDLMEERSILRILVERLRVCAENSGVKFEQFVDLRWGISEESVRSGKLLQLCVRAVDACIPFFLCIIGRRNGKPVDRSWLRQLRELEIGWMDEDVELAEGFSATEVEIWHSMKIRRGLMTRESFFAIEGCDEVHSLPYSTRINHLLREVLISPFANTLELGDRVYRRLSAQISQLALERRHPEEDHSDDSIARDHNLHAAALLENYQGDVDLIQLVGTQIQASHPSYILVEGDAGRGKSTFMAALARKFVAIKNPVFLHFCALNRQSSQLTELLTRLIHEIIVYLGEEEDIAAALSLPEKIKQLPTWIALAGKNAHRHGKVAVFIIDGLDQLCKQDDHDLDPSEWSKWLPAQPADGTAIILSHRTGEPGGFANDLVNGHWPRRHTIGPLPMNARNVILERALHPRLLNERLRSGIVKSKLGGSPLYLVTAGDELRAVDDRTHLSNAVEELAGCYGFVLLFVRIISRMEADFHKMVDLKSAGVFLHTLGLLFVSRQGLGRDVLVSLTSSDDSSPEKREAAWEIGSMIIPRHLLKPQPRYNFAHEEFREAVGQMIKARGIVEQCKLDVADYFYLRWREGHDDRELHAELPWALLEVIKLQSLKTRWIEYITRLVDYLCDLSIISRQSDESSSELGIIFRELLKCFSEFFQSPPFDLRETLFETLMRNFGESSMEPERKSHLLYFIAATFNVLNENKLALDVVAYAKGLTTEGSPEWCRATLLTGDILREGTNYDSALVAYQRARAYQTEESGTHIFSRATYGIARVFRLKGEFEHALRYYQSAYDSLPSELNYPQERTLQLPWRHFGLGEIFRLLNDLDNSYFHYCMATKLFNEVGDTRGTAHSVWGEAEIARLRDQSDHARMLFEKSASLCEDIGDIRSKAWAHLGIAELYRAEFHALGSHSARQRAEALCSEILNDSRMPETEKFHAMLQMAECRRLASVVEPKLCANAREMYGNCLRYYESRKMRSCVEICKRGEFLLDEMERNLRLISMAQVDYHTFTFP